MNQSAQKDQVDRNYDAFVRILSSLLPDHRDRWALMRDGAIVSIHDAVGEAYDVGKAKFLDELFSIQEVTDEPIDLGFWSHVASH